MICLFLCFIVLPLLWIAVRHFIERKIYIRREVSATTIYQQISELQREINRLDQEKCKLGQLLLLDHRYRNKMGTSIPRFTEGEIFLTTVEIDFMIEAIKFQQAQLERMYKNV